MEKIDHKSASLMFIGALLVATGYGATFLLNRHFKSFGGNEIDTGTILIAAMAGTFVSVPVVGWYARSLGAANMAGAGAIFLAAGFAVIGSVTEVSVLAILGGGAIGIGWGAFYLAGPLALSQRVSNADRGYWFMRFAAFQMAGIGFSPFLAELALASSTITTSLYFYAITVACMIACLLLFRFERRLPMPQGPGGTTPWIGALPRILTSPARFPIVMVALGAAVFSAVMTFQTSLVEGSTLLASTFFVVYAVTVVVARWTLAGLISRHPSSKTVPLLLVSMVLGTALLYILALGLVPQVLSAIFLGIGYGLVYPLIQAQVVNDVSDDADQGAALTWFVMTYFIGIFGFPLLAGWLIVALSTNAVITAVVLLGGLELLLALWRNRAVRRADVTRTA